MNLIKKINVDINKNIKITYLCDGQEILPESYYALEADLEEDFEDDVDYDEELTEYNYDEEPCSCVDCTIDRYVEKISNLGLVCPHCVREALEQMVDEILD
jgi:hypothetical protein